MHTAEQLKEEGWIDEILISPNEDKDLVAQVLGKWFSKYSNKTHNVEGVLFFPNSGGLNRYRLSTCFKWTRMLCFLAAKMMMSLMR